MTGALAVAVAAGVVLAVLPAWVSVHPVGRLLAAPAGRPLTAAGARSAWLTAGHDLADAARRAEDALLHAARAERAADQRHAALIARRASRPAVVARRARTRRAVVVVTR